MGDWTEEVYPSVAKPPQNSNGPLTFFLCHCVKNVSQSVVKVQAFDDVYMGTSLQKVDWGQLPVDIMSNYMHMTDALLSDLVVPDDVVTCSGG